MQEIGRRNGLFNRPLRNFHEKVIYRGCVLLTINSGLSRKGRKTIFRKSLTAWNPGLARLLANFAPQNFVVPGSDASQLDIQLLQCAIRQHLNTVYTV